jgi:hypothetical protein
MLDNDEDKERLDDILENLVNAMEETHRNLQNLKNVLISLLEQLRAAAGCFLSEHLHLRIRMLPNLI